ncbi:hypothetical protein [Floridanema evergladense]|uniref:Uncharacterized protein n=1 Tax=Floridaenema evergladense BLCC-F167 TaxID=3153639 RepID=A0ABV4WGM2_9CYAN
MWWQQIWTKKKLTLVAIGAGLSCVFLFFLLLSLFVGAEKSNTTGWQNAAVAAPQELVRQAVEQNYLSAPEAATLDFNRVKVLPIKASKSKPLYIFDFNTPNLCGIGGCLYAVYTEDGTPILRLMLQNKLPKNVPLFSVSDKFNSGYPCLVISQLNPEKMNVRDPKIWLMKSLYCYSGSGFTLFNNSITEIAAGR